MKKFLALSLVLLLLSVALLAACGDSNSSDPEPTPDDMIEATPEAPPEVTPETPPETTPDATPEAPPETTPDVTPEATPEETPNAAPVDTLYGAWNWLGTEYYVFNTDGTGSMAGMPIRWRIRNNNILSICGTPDLCGTTCIAPAEWTFVLDGNNLTLDSTTLDMSFEYTRR